MIKRETLDQIHELLAADMLDRLQNGSRVLNKDSGEIVSVSPTAADLNVIRQFLKDNGVDRVMTPDTGDSPFDKLVKGVDATINRPN